MKDKISSRNYFTIERTLVVKGVAILLLLWHHISRAYFSNDGWITVTGMVFKVCVCIFLILSGYGMMASYDNNVVDQEENVFNFVFRHLKKLMFAFWAIYIFFLPINLAVGRKLGEIYGSMRWDNMLIDFLGLNHIFDTPSMVGTWWFMGAIISFYIFFPYLAYMLKKNKTAFVVINFLIALFVGFSMHNIIQSTNPILFYLFAFSMGMYLAEMNLINIILEILYKRRVLFIVYLTGLLLSVYLRLKIGNEFDTLLGVLIIVFCAYFIPMGGLLERFLRFLGVYSSDIFMIHSFVYAWCFKEYVYICHNIFVVILLTLLYSLIFSVIINFIKKFLINLCKNFCN